MSMSKVKSYAEEGLESIQANATADWKKVGGSGELEPIALYYRTSAPKKPGSTAIKVLSKGDTIIGTYEGSFTAENSKYKTPTHKVRVDGKLHAFGGSTLLNNGFKEATIGKGVKIVYGGTAPNKRGGNDTQLFSVFVEPAN